MSEKNFKTYDEMIGILQVRGMDIPAQSYGNAKRILQHEGYYNLINGYKALFLETDDQNHFLVPDKFKEGTTIEEIRALYSFDRDLRSIVLNAILRIETNIKNLVSYSFAKVHGHKNYLIYSNFDDSQKDAPSNITKLISEIQRQIASRVSDPSISHYLKTHGYIPLWVLNNILTLGTISKFYSLMKQPERQEVAKIFSVQDNELVSILTYLSAVRNICAHSNRLYCFRTKRPLTNLQVHTQLNIPKGTKCEYSYGKRDLFAVMIIFSVLLSKTEFCAAIKQIHAAQMQLNGSLHVLSPDDVLSRMGFPNDWYRMLKSLY